MKIRLKPFLYLSGFILVSLFFIILNTDTNPSDVDASDKLIYAVVCQEELDRLVDKYTIPPDPNNDPKAQEIIRALRKSTKAWTAITE